MDPVKRTCPIRACEIPHCKLKSYLLTKHIKLALSDSDLELAVATQDSAPMPS